MGDVGHYKVYLWLPLATVDRFVFHACSRTDENQYFLVALDLTLPLPSVPGVLSRWFAEPVQHVYVPTSTFIPNGKGYPVLPKGTQLFLQDLMKVRGAFTSLECCLYVRRVDQTLFWRVQVQDFTQGELRTNMSTISAILKNPPRTPSGRRKKIH